jgi:hypothetical protein
MKTAINSLRLVYPPVSNQEAEWLKSDEDVEEMLRKSNLYMIAQRREARFIWNEDDLINPEGRIPFGFEIPGVAFGKGTFSIESDVRNHDKLEYEFGEKYIRVSKRTETEGELGEVLWWYSTESLLFSKWRGDKRIDGLDNYRDFTIYSLFYVGISTDQDSFQRLLATGHHKRVAVLSNETQLVSGARLTDEVILFFFESDPFFVHTFDDGKDFSNFGMGMPFTKNQATSDAERAFTKFLGTQYNSIKYKAFPRGKGGLYDLGLARYAHVIAEDITFETSSTSLRGAFAMGMPCGESADAILVEGDRAEIYRPKDNGFA